jgi:alkylation response protein AidB-like acyl-CoA dehydrogenase
VSAELLASIRGHREEFEAAGERAEELRTLPPDTVETLREMGVFWLKTPEELGGTPMQRHLRDALAARQHVAVSEEHYEAAGRERITAARRPRTSP